TTKENGMFGEGKSAIVRAYAEQHGIPVIDIKMSTWDFRDEYYAAFRDANGFDSKKLVEWTNNGWWIFEGEPKRKYRRQQLIKMTATLRERAGRERDVSFVKSLIVDMEA